MPRSFMMPATLQTLPIEIICHIFSNLDMLDLLACSMTAKHLRRVVMSSSQLQYIIELGKHRMVSLLPTAVGPSFSTRLNLLRDRETAWKYLNWKKRDTLRLPPTGSVYEFVGGLYGNGREDDRRVTASISFLELPSADALFPGKPDQELQMWTHTMGDIHIVDFTMDPSQDLLVLVALAPPESRYIYELHLRSIKTNQPHSKAPVSSLSCLRKPSVHLQSSEIVAAVRVQVAGNLVALLIKEAVEGTSAHLEIWNWENSPQFSCAMDRADGIDDFTFLSHDSFLLVLPPGQFEVYTFVDPLKFSTKPVLRVSYAFPPLSDGYLYWYISMSSNPAPGYVPRCPTDEDDQHSTGTNRQSYYPRADERIHACCLYIFNPSVEETQHVHAFVFFLNLQTLLNPPVEWFPRPSSPPPLASTSLVVPKRSPGNTSNSEISSPAIISSVTPINSASTAGLSSLQLSSNILYPLLPRVGTPGSSTTGQGSSHKTYSNSGNSNSEGPNVHLATRSCRPRTWSRSSIPVVTIPWEVWGPQSTRWFEECLSTDWQHAVYGLRTVESVSLEKRPLENLPLPDYSISAPNGSNHVSAGNAASWSTSPLSSSSINSNTDYQPIDPTSQPTQVGDEGQDPDDSQGNETGAQRKFLRIRDFNPYSFIKLAEPLDRSSEPTDKKGKRKAPLRTPRLVDEPSTTPVKGVFTKDIVSSLPYMEILSEEAFEVTDVMMDDCRLLLLKRDANTGKLKRVDVLMM